jgi:hypothetical protein
MADVQHYLNIIWGFVHEGFNNVNAVEGLVIALVAAIVAPAWDRIWAVALGATLVHLIADVIIPVVARHAAFRLPPLLDFAYMRTAASLYVGYLIVIAVLMLIKRMFLTPAHAH